MSSLRNEKLESICESMLNIGMQFTTPKDTLLFRASPYEASVLQQTWNGERAIDYLPILSGIQIDKDKIFFDTIIRDRESGKHNTIEEAYTYYADENTGNIGYKTLFTNFNYFCNLLIWSDSISTDTYPCQSMIVYRTTRPYRYVILNDKDNFDQVPDEMLHQDNTVCIVYHTNQFYTVVRSISIVSQDNTILFHYANSSKLSLWFSPTKEYRIALKNLKGYKYISAFVMAINQFFEISTASFMSLYDMPYNYKPVDGMITSTVADRIMNAEFVVSTVFVDRLRSMEPRNTEEKYAIVHEIVEFDDIKREMDKFTQSFTLNNNKAYNTCEIELYNYYDPTAMKCELIVPLTNSVHKRSRNNIFFKLLDGKIIPISRNIAHIWFEQWYSYYRHMIQPIEIYEMLYEYTRNCTVVDIKHRVDNIRILFYIQPIQR